MKQAVKTLLFAAGLGLSSPAFAGNIVLTGHDNDYHQSPDANAATVAELSFVRNGSTLPVLVIDQGTEAVSLVQKQIGAANVVAIAPGAVTAATFDHSLYSAFVVASVTTCGGCDNPVGTGTQLAAFNTAIASFFNAGGGILGLAGATDPDAYAYVPSAATNAGGFPPAFGYVQTAAGAALGIVAVNGDPTHNFFAEPGSTGLSSAYVVVERLGDAVTGTPETIALSNGVITCPEGTVAGSGGCVISGGDGPTTVPEPMSLALLGSALAFAGVVRRRNA